MGQAEVVVAVVQGELLVQARFALAQGGDASADRRHMLPDGEVEAVTVDGVWSRNPNAPFYQRLRVRYASLCVLPSATLSSILPS